MSLKRSHEQDDRPITPSTAPYFESSYIEDRASKFIAVFSPSIAPKTLQAHDPYRLADHRILAWRRQSKQQSLTSMSSASSNAKIIYDTGSDDDGEKYAGKKLEKLLIDLNMVGSVVVARWYGGVLLGPVRFDHIVNVAKEAIGKWRSFDSSASSAKKPRVDATPTLTPEQEKEQKLKLATVLQNRDSSISVLRDLLAEKKGANPAGSQSSQTVKTQPNYANMPLTTLKKLESAKDKTIAWILEQIEEAEKPETGGTEHTQQKTE